VRGGAGFSFPRVTSPAGEQPLAGRQDQLHQLAEPPLVVPEHLPPGLGDQRIRGVVHPLVPALQAVARVPGRLRLAHGLLLDAEPDDEVLQQHVRPRRPAHAEALRRHRGQPRLGAAQDLHVGQRRAGRHLRAVAVPQQLLAGDPGVRGQGRAPGLVDGPLGQPQADPPPDLRAHLVQQVLLAAHVPVERGRLHVEPRRDLAQRQPVQTLGVQGLQGGPHDLRLRQSLAHA
jgi:hypothetical protein